MVMLIY